MTVDTEVSSIVYTGIVDGVPLAAPFPVQTEDDVTVFYGADVVATIGVHYTVALDPPDYETASVTPLTGFAAISAGTVAINRIVPYLNTDDIPQHATLASSRLEQMIDRVVFMAQQLRDQLGRVVRYPSTDPTNSLGALPAKADRMNKVLGFDSNGVPVAVENVPVGTLTLSAFGTTWIALADAASALTTLGFTTIGSIGRALVAATTKGAARSAIDALAAGDTIAFSGNNTHSGTNAFSGAVTVLAPAADLQPATKKYTDDAIAAALPMGTVINQSISGVNYRYLTAVGTATVAPSAGCKVWDVDYIGAGGGGGVVGAAGVVGGDTTFNAVVAKGGGGGGGGDAGGLAAQGGAAGTGGAGAATHRQTTARGDIGAAGTITDVLGGNGAPSPFGCGGGAGANAPANSGAGGGGGPGTTPAGGGGGGGAGELVKVVIVNPSLAGYSYTITAGGAAGAGGGAGGSGTIRIAEYFNY